MRLTLAGKIALFANLVLSLMFAFWGFGIYSQRINWSDKKIGDREGEYAIRDAEIKQLQKSRPNVEKGWLDATQAVVHLEADRPKKQQWYAQQLAILKTGDAKQKILDIEFEQGRSRIDPKTGLPRLKAVTDASNKLIPGLASLPVLNSAYREIQGNIVKITEEIERLLQEEKQLTEQLGNGKDRGLRFDLAQQQVAEKRSLDEQEYLQPLLYNSMVEQQSLEERRNVLEDRLKKLQATSVAKQP
ncbi:MAG TPA: hypothetical protein VKU02_13600 [Gemmataceae bacterium]|nr:hypothetical protein [Gemmataceae bacterium]